MGLGYRDHLDKIPAGPSQVEREQGATLSAGGGGNSPEEKH